MPQDSLPNSAAYLAAILATALCLTLLWGTVASADFVQEAGATSLGFEAEAYDSSTAGSRFLIVDKTPTLVTPYGTDALPSYANASGDSAILANFSGTTNILTYNVEFNTAGDYVAYAHYSMFEGTSLLTTYGNEDSPIPYSLPRTLKKTWKISEKHYQMM